MYEVRLSNYRDLREHTVFMAFTITVCRIDSGLFFIVYFAKGVLNSYYLFSYIYVIKYCVRLCKNGYRLMQHPAVYFPGWRM